MTVRNVLALGATLFVLTGCTSTVDDDFDDEKTATAVAALDVGTDATEIDGLESLDAAKAAQELALVKVKGCRTRTVDPSNPNVVHVVLDGCTGRFDRHSVSGTMTVTFSPNADGSLHAEKVGNLTIDGRAFTRTVSADIKVTGNVRVVSRHAEKVGTKKTGESVTHSSDAVVVTDKTTRCRTVNGTGRSIVAGDRTIETTITNLQTCETDAGEDYCPTGTIEHVNASKGKTSLTTFNGSVNVSIDVSKPKGDKTKSWTLDCLAR
ncbi:MAG: hypothetical protein JST00_18140 [Deltaproteobacteria bacterium]|nr:hypothetical protein [Deltaproteobacteria bacterium]